MSAVVKQHGQSLYGIIDRVETEMPDYYLPSASGVLIAGQTILAAAGVVPGASAPTGWSLGASGFRKLGAEPGSFLWVQACGDFWVIERTCLMPDGFTQEEALVCAFARLPIWTRTREAAMRLAEHCDPLPRPPVAGCWADTGNVRI